MPRPYPASCLRLSLAALVLLLISAVPALRSTDLPEVPDQYGQPVALDDSSHTVQVAIVVTAKRLRRIKPWEKALIKAFPDLKVVRVADIPRTSPTTYEKVAVKLRKRLPKDLSVGIDLEGDWAKRVNLDTSVPNLLLFDVNGRLAAVHSGMYKASRFEPVRSDLESLLAQAGNTIDAPRE
ncbi:MAG TPA: hypothetical protein ENK16_06210 [Chromatiales bacterium]|nr:hypothetical protein [Chromatiales bacterium]